MQFLGIIPARYASTRFPGKPLALLGGRSVIERVYSRVAGVLGKDATIVATDDDRIADAVAAFGGKAVMTNATHRSGTDRCREAYERSGSTADVVINIQGDEPFIAPEQIRTVMEAFADPAVEIASLARPFDATRGYSALENPNTPKVVMDNAMNAMYFSRSVIPYVRGSERSEWSSETQYYTHIGLYAYRADVLKTITALPQSAAELAESLEQLRWLQAGYKIRMGLSDEPTIGIDTPADLAAAEEYLKNNGENA